jgi:hypothetical protein
MRSVVCDFSFGLRFLVIFADLPGQYQPLIGIHGFVATPILVANFICFALTPHVWAATISFDD